MTKLKTLGEAITELVKLEKQWSYYNSAIVSHHRELRKYPNDDASVKRIHRNLIASNQKELGKVTAQLKVVKLLIKPFESIGV